MDAVPPPPPASSVVPLSSSLSKATVVVQASVFLLVPVFALVLAARVLLRRYHSRRALIAVHQDGSGGQIYAACTMLALLVSFGTLAGAFPLSQALGGTLDEGETTRMVEVVQALMGFLVGAAVLHLTTTTADSDAHLHRKWHRIISTIQKVYRISLVIILCSATLLALLAPFLHHASVSRIPPALPPALFLAYTALALPRVLVALFQAKQTAYTPDPDAQRIPTFVRRPSPAYNLDFGYDPATSRSSSIGSPTLKSPIPFTFPGPNAITYPPRTPTGSIRSKPTWVAALGVEVPLPSTPASTLTARSTPRRGLRAQVSLSALGAKGLGSVKMKSLGSPTSPAGTMRRPITIHVATQRTSWTYSGEESRESRGRSGNVRVCLPPLLSPSTSCSEDSHDEAENDTRKTPMQDKWAGRRASTSTVGTDGDGDSAFNANANIKGTLGLPPPLTPIESDVEVMPRQHRASPQVDGDVDADADDVYRPWSAEWGSSEESGRPRFTERERGSLGGITIVEGFRAVSDKNEGKGGMGIISRAKWIFAWILGAQLGALGAWGCALALGLQRTEYGADGMRVGETLEIVRAVFVVLAVCGSMGAYFVHISNLKQQRLATDGARTRSHHRARAMTPTGAAGYRYYAGSQRLDAPIVTTTTETKVSPSVNMRDAAFSAIPASAPTAYARYSRRGGSPTVRSSVNSTSNTQHHHKHSARANKKHDDPEDDEDEDEDNVQGYAVHTPPLTTMYSPPVQTLDLRRALASRPAPIHLADPPPPRARRRAGLSGVANRPAHSELHRHSEEGSLAGTRSSGSHTHEPLLRPHERGAAQESDAYEAAMMGDKLADVLRLSSSVEEDDSVEERWSLERMHEGELVGNAGEMRSDVGRGIRSPISPPSTPMASKIPRSAKRYSTASTAIPSPNTDNGRRYVENWQTKTYKYTPPTTPRAASDNPRPYVQKRGSLPVPVAARKIFGWEFGWDTAPAAGGEKGKIAKKSTSMRELRERDGGDDASSFIDLRGDHGYARGLSLGSSTTSSSSKDGRKGKRQSLLSGIVPMGGVEEVVGGEGAVKSGVSALRKLRNQARSMSGSGTVVDVPASVASAHTHTSSLPRRFSFKPASNVDNSTPSGLQAPESLSARGFSFGRGFGLGHREKNSSSSAGAENRDVETRSGQQKKSIKLGVGRTMGPGLTLAAASTRSDLTEAREKVEKIQDDYSSVEKDESRDGEGDDDSVNAARLVSASIARVTPAATLLAAPKTPSRSGYRMSYSSVPPAYNVSPTREVMAISQSPNRRSTPPIAVSPTSLVPSNTAKPLSSPSKSRPGSRSAWKPHPFADPSDDAATLRSPVRAVMMEEVDVGDLGDEEDVVQLEKEMEELRRGSSDIREADSEKALRDFHVTLNPIGGRPLQKVNSDNRKTEKDRLLEGSGEHSQTRTSLSAPPMPKSDWVPQASTTTTSNFPYRFPMIFGSSSASSSSSSSPSRIHVALAPSHRPNSTLTTQRSTSTLRLPSRTMDTVRNAFAGVGARMSRISVAASSTGTPTRSGDAVTSSIVAASTVGAEDSDGDFMDLRDPFASPPSVAKISAPTTKKAFKAGAGNYSKAWKDNFLVVDAVCGLDEGEGGGGGSGGGGRGESRAKRRMSAWGRLPIPRTLSPVPSSTGASVIMGAGKRTSVGGRSVSRPGRLKSATRLKSKKERRARKATSPGIEGMSVSSTIANKNVGDEDVDFGLEEALLTQRLLRRLDSAEWEME